MSNEIFLGDEAVAQAAIDAGISAAYGYPGTPSTEIMEYLLDRSGPFRAAWCANEKTALEGALGVSFVGQRSIVTMKHVGLNVASDPFINAAVCKLHGGLVIAVADDPGMHSSQDEQDSRFYADFAMTACLEPADQQEAYDMTLEAFEVSERFHLPVLLRLTTRLSHSRSAVCTRPPLPRKPYARSPEAGDWMLLPAFARRNYERLCAVQAELEAWSESRLAPMRARAERLVITSGLGRNYFLENLGEMDQKPAHIHVSSYPAPLARIREAAKGAKEVIVIEEGQPYLERILRGPARDAKGVGEGGPCLGEARLRGKLDGLLPRQGELNPENVRLALGLEPRTHTQPSQLSLPPRPPQLCQGCPHGDSYAALNEALIGLGPSSVTSDIGCYSLGALKPHQAIQSIVCMGASIGMALGSAEAGTPYAVAVLGDSTFLHSGITGLVDAVARKAPITVLILDNSIVAMTGCQDTILPSGALEKLVLGLGVEADHLHVFDAKAARHAENVALIRREIEYRGLSVLIARRECLEAFRRHRAASPKEGEKA